MSSAKLVYRWEAESRFGTKRATILKWIEDGLVRCEQLKVRLSGKY
jgi:hypothetical protein